MPQPIHSRRRFTLRHSRMKMDFLQSPTAVARFWSFVNKEGPHSEACGSKCWVWNRGIGRSGYGNFSAGDKTYSAHRVSFALAHGASPKLWVLHRCDNRACVNPSHLFEGDAKVNNSDCNQKGRRNPSRGEAHLSCKLSDSDIAAISMMNLRKGMYGPLLDKYGVSYKTLWAISHGKYKRKPCTVPA